MAQRAYARAANRLPVSATARLGQPRNTSTAKCALVLWYRKPAPGTQTANAKLGAPEKIFVLSLVKPYPDRVPKGEAILRGQNVGKIGSAVLRIAVLAAAALIVLAAVWLIASVVQRQLQPIQHREAPHPPDLPFGRGQMKPP